MRLFGSAPQTEVATKKNKRKQSDSDLGFSKLFGLDEIRTTPFK
jgi:hypothetical protein